MDELLLTGRSLTNAQRMVRCLERGNIRCTMTRMPDSIRGTGCGYVVRIRRVDFEAVMAQLERCGLRVQRIYQYVEGNGFQEVSL